MGLGAQVHWIGRGVEVVSMVHLGDLQVVEVCAVWEVAVLVEAMAA